MLSSEPDQDRFRRYNLSELTRQINGRRAGQFIGGEHDAIRPNPIEGVGGIDDERDVVPQVPSHPGGGFAAVIRRDPADGQCAYVRASQPGIEIWVPIERRVNRLLHEEFMWPINPRHEFIPRLPRSQR